ncbi:ABC transporter [Apiospora rasikravindrae]|uniref:ABC transporter n=1 Tax=Apiospora rasikravindrae TaxID=990691 RepID=A0ABR1TEE5_9PEZI
MASPPGGILKITLWKSSTTAVGLFYCVGLLPDPDVPYTVSKVQNCSWLISLIFEVVQIVYLPGNHFQHGWIAILLTTFASLRVLILICMIALFKAASHNVSNRHHIRRDPEESAGLLERNAGENGSYGAARTEDNGNKASRPTGDAQTTSWLDYFLGFRKLFPYIWPSNSRTLQIRAMFCFCLLIAQRVVNILAPHQLGVVIAELGPGKLPIKTYCYTYSSVGYKDSKSTYSRLSEATFDHVLRLSLDFHITKRIGELTSALSKGGALNTFLDGLLFQLFPMVIDLWIAAAYFFIFFDAFHALIALSVTWFYLYITIYMAKYRGRARREMARPRTDALLSYETVHQNDAVPTELGRYSRLITHFQEAEYRVFFSLNLLNGVQNSIFTMGTLLACYLNAYQISIDLHHVSMFVTLITYLAQLQAPLNFFGSFYTQVQNNLVDAERMLELVEEKPTVTDREGAVKIERCAGAVRFSNVSFEYIKGQPALQHVSFDAEPGTSTAIVGESGSGKSTILKLLFRFHDVDDGQIQVDGVDIRDLQLESLRRHIGVVPQDTILFNDSLMYNLRYAKPDASDQEVHAACTGASIHNKVLGFPQGYATPVGERGLKLSGGERQRSRQVAIARAFLKSPKILLLDEATASLDSETEGRIQDSLESISKGRTTITIAHRLSTITRADQILVLHKGCIVERGRHTDLLAMNGLYAAMWTKQTKAEEPNS